MTYHSRNTCWQANHLRECVDIADSVLLEQLEEGKGFGADLKYIVSSGAHRASYQRMKEIALRAIALLEEQGGKPAGKPAPFIEMAVCIDTPSAGMREEVAR